SLKLIIPPVARTQVSLADSFLADLDELSDNEVQLDAENIDAAAVEEDDEGDMPDIETLNYDDLDSVSKLQKTQRYNDIMQVVKKIGNEMDLTLVDLEGLLPSAIIMVVSVTASTTSGQPLSEENLQRTIDACDRALALDLAKKKVLDFVESRMGYIAPNVSAIVGSAVAAKLMGTAGDSEPKKKRGGHQLRKMKERYAITEMRKLANRMQFGVPEESSLGDGLGEGYGMLSQAGSGKLRVSIGQSKLAAKAAKRYKEKHSGSSGATSGLTSSLAFTPVQGIELTNPQAHGNQLGSGTQSTYFSEMGTFSKIKRM
ncbi:U4 U6 small nuclear ribonucleoprotein, partial [Musa troglodytarum]